MGVRVPVLALAAVVLAVVPAAAQSGGFGIGPRLTLVSGGEPDAGSQRVTGAAIRLGGGMAAVEIAMDFRSTLDGDLTERARDYPIQGSLLVFPVRQGSSLVFPRGLIAPYLLGGIGWYSQRVEPLGPVQIEARTERKIGYHGGFGAELRLHRHIAFYGDYRYTFIRFGHEDGLSLLNLPMVNGLKMSHEGSMFTGGATFYF